MTDGQKRTELMRTDMALRALWGNWMISFGAIIFPVFIAIFVPRIWVPFACLLAAYFLSVTKKSDSGLGRSMCSMLTSLTATALYISAAVMFVVVILCTDWLVPTVIHLKLYNADLPFVTCLVEFPVVIALCAVNLYLGLGSRNCRRCQRRHGYYAGDSIVATLYYRESKYQTWILMVLSVMLGAVQYWYYFAKYINYNRNDPDLFFFNIMPVAVYVISLVLMAGRYRGLHSMYATLEASLPGGSGASLLRFMVFCGNDLLLRRNDEGLWDTPMVEIIARTDTVGETQARISFRALSGIENFRLRYCYTNDGFARGTNVIHYAAFVAEEYRGAFREDDGWFNAFMIDQAMASGAIAPILANELYRIHTMTMAWKTYDRNGRRLYPIKHYRPTFRLGDLEKWEVDYDDTSWFDIAANNEDNYFFLTHRAWDRLTNLFRKKKPTVK